MNVSEEGCHTLLQTPQGHPSDQSIEARLDALESGEGEATGSTENASRNTLDADVGSFGESDWGWGYPPWAGHLASVWGGMPAWPVGLGYSAPPVSGTAVVPEKKAEPEPPARQYQLTPWEQRWQSGKAASADPGQVSEGKETAATNDKIEHYPQGEVSLPLGDHLLLATKEKIWRNEYVDMFSLLFRETEPREGEKGDRRDRERIRYKTVDRNWSNWLAGYMVYMGVVLQKQPARGASMVKYLDIIYHAFSEYSGPAWARYDEAFRRHSAMNPELPWDCQHQQLWMRIMGPNRPGGGEFSDSGHFIVKSAATPTRGQMPGAAGQFRQPCWEFASTGTCSRRPCRFRHACTICGGTHSSNFCPKGRWPRPAPKDGPAARKGGSPAPAKGT
ncbi:uncharacterized protein LOC128324664 isoform X3 [Hemicordylus capensis]|uniref:uncharacterized protein LOC128324664 isoform X3 n=1 Tax=Hemicordylus capensis TaxID=884348 RepID=UPI00230352F8|nr:uncharacterized protein LOC128324664 isoform X3 [Hemicordylus capensis]